MSCHVTHNTIVLEKNCAEKALHEDAKCACLELCDETSITQSLYITNWPHGAAADAIMLQYPMRSDELRHALVHEADMRLQLLKIEVFFDELVYERISESPAYDVRRYFAFEDNA